MKHHFQEYGKNLADTRTKYITAVTGLDIVTYDNILNN
jgi:hypothetical protein